MRPTARVPSPGILLLACCLAFAVMPAARAQGGDPDGLPRLDPAALGTAVALRFEPPAPVRDIYRAIGALAGIEVAFDPRLHDQELSLDLRGLDLRTALDRTSRAGGHFWHATDAAGIVVADDTPQNRRTYEPQVIRTFDVEHIRLPALMTVLRSALALKNFAVDEGGQTITLRDTAAKVAIAGRIIDRLDRPRDQVVLALELLRVPRATVAALRGGDDAELMRLDAAGYRQLRAGATVIAEPTLSVLEGEPASYRLAEPIDLAAGDRRHLDLDLRFDARPHPSSQSMTLRVRAEARLGRAGEPTASRSATAALAAGSGEIVALFDWLPLDQPDGDPVAVVVVRPRLVAGSAGSGNRQAGFYVGTESAVRLPRPLP